MQLMLTSFGIAEKNYEPSKDQSLFYNMPPVSMRSIVNNFFMPDYATLILCDEVILDESTFISLQEDPPLAYELVANTIKTLHDEGFVKLVNFRQILKRKENLLQKMLEHDLKMPDQWLGALMSSLDTWHHFCESFRGANIYEPIDDSSWMHPDHSASHLLSKLQVLRRRYSEHSASRLFLHNFDLSYNPMEKAIKLYRKGSEYRSDELRQVLSSYLSYVNANIVLSDEIGVGFHDWADFLPFYQLKFLSVGKEDIKSERQIEESQKLFEVSFPEFVIADTQTLIRALKDKRIADLRDLVDNAVKGEVTFDQKFAKDVLKEVFGLERRTGRYRKIISYVTIPIDFVPWIGTAAEKVIEEAAGTLLERKLKEKYRWFYLLSDVAEETKGRKEEDIEKTSWYILDTARENEKAGVKLVESLLLKIQKEKDLEKIGRVYRSFERASKIVKLKLVDINILSSKIKNEKDLGKIGRFIIDIAKIGEGLGVKLVCCIDIEVLLLKIKKEKNIGKVGLCVASIAGESKEIAQKIVNRLNPKLREELRKGGWLHWTK